MQVELSYSELAQRIRESRNGVFFVSGKTFERANLSGKLGLDDGAINLGRFSNFSENPYYEEVVEGVDLYKKSNAEIIVAVGGGTAIDLAKLIKYYAEFDFSDPTEELPTVDSVNRDIQIVAVPTTFGTGSESTHFAVMYYQGKKYSVASDDLLPDMILIDESFSATLPKKVKASSCLDALCQAIESLWSKNCTEESAGYAIQAIESIVRYFEGYVTSDFGAAHVARAANLAGKAINITKTTAPHALSYTLTSDYSIPHGHAVALCIRNVFEINLSKISDLQCAADLAMKRVFQAMGVDSSAEAKALVEKFMKLSSLEVNFKSLGVPANDLDRIVNHVNLERLSNHPVDLAREDLLYMLTD